MGENQSDQPFQHRACIALGANLGEREAMLRRALDILNALDDVRVRAVSTLFNTTPVGGPADQPRYLNAAAVIETNLSPTKLLKLLLDTERELGRDRTSPERNQPRVIDLDLLLYDDLVLHAPGLELPHPRMHERAFVLQPLNEIAPQWVHPILGRTVADLWAALT